MISLLGEGKAAAEALVRLGDSFEGLARDEDAASAYRRAAELGDASFAHAFWALAELSARRGDRGALAEALAGIAAGTTDDVVRGDSARGARLAVRPTTSRRRRRASPPWPSAPAATRRPAGQGVARARRNDAGELGLRSARRPSRRAIRASRGPCSCAPRL